MYFIFQFFQNSLFFRRKIFNRIILLNIIKELKNQKLNNKIKSSNIYRKYYLENRFLEDKKNSG